MGFGVRAIGFGFLAALVVGDELQLDRQQSLGEVAGESSRVDRRHCQDSAEFEDYDVVIGEEGSVDHTVAGDRTAEARRRAGRE